MTFYAFGLNYQFAPVDVAESFPLSADTQRALYNDLDLSAPAEVLLLSTCNRKEVYLYGTEEDVRQIQAALSARADRSWPHEHAFRYENEQAVRHVVQVTAGLRSLVLGDSQVFAQVKEAYQRAVDCGGIRSIMHRLMHAAFRAAKQVAAETNLASGAASVSTAAVAMACDHFTDRQGMGRLDGLRVLLVGAGEMGELALSALDEKGPSAVGVTNRSLDTAQTVAAEHGAEPVPWSKRYGAVANADVVIVATGASEPVLTASRLSPGSADDGRGTLFVDISMPRTVEPEVDALAGYTVYDLDDLKAWTDQIEAERESEVPRAETICEEQLEEFVTWVFHQEAMEPAIQALRDTFDAIRKQEVERHAHRTGMNKAEVDQLTKSIMQKLLAVPIVKLKNVDPDSVDFVQGIQLLQALFSRPSCEDESAHSLDQRPDSHTPSLADVSADFSFESPEEGEERSSEMIRRALSITRDAGS